MIPYTLFQHHIEFGYGVFGVRRDRQAMIPEGHELMMRARVRATETKFAEPSDKIAAFTRL